MALIRDDFPVPDCQMISMNRTCSDMATNLTRPTIRIRNLQDVELDFMDGSNYVTWDILSRQEMVQVLSRPQDWWILVRSETKPCLAVRR